jgi:hypothetical protein
MTAVNINVEEFIKLLSNLRSTGVKLINLDMLPDDNHPKMNKLVIHPVRSGRKGQDESVEDNLEDDPSIRNPDISTDNDDIFNLFNDLI